MMEKSVGFTIFNIAQISCYVFKKLFHTTESGPLESGLFH